MTTIEVVTRVHQLLAELETVSEAPSRAAPDQDQVSTGKSEDRAPPGVFQNDETLRDEWASMFSRLCFAGERALKHYRGQEKSVKLLSREERTARILTYPRGISPTFIAFIEGVTESHVRQLRAKARADARREAEDA